MGVQSSKPKIKFIDFYDVGEIIGQGTFASVHKCFSKSDSSQFAVKIINKIHLDEDELTALSNEMTILKHISHKNIIKLVSVFDEDNTIFIILELINGHDLYDLTLANNTRLTEKTSAKIMYEVCNALQYLHCSGFVHRDLKPENILITNDGRIKITDFGLAHANFNVTLSCDSQLMKTICGTPLYVAPEIIKGEAYNYKCDMWSMGVILYILLCGFHPFNSVVLPVLYRAIIKGDYGLTSKKWNTISKEGKDLVQCLLNVDPEKRYSAKQVKNHPWIKKYCT
eukprot:UN00806